MDAINLEKELDKLSLEAKEHVLQALQISENEKRNRQIKQKRREVMQRFQNDYINNDSKTLEDCLEELVNCVHEIYDGKIHSRIYEVKHLSEIKRILDKETLDLVKIPFVLQRQYDSRNNPRMNIRSGDYLPIIEGRVTGDAFLKKTIVVSVDNDFCGECHPDALYSADYDSGLFEPKIKNRAAVPLKTQYSNTIEYIFIIDHEDEKPIDAPIIENLRSLTRDAQSMIYQKKWKTIIDQAEKEEEIRKTILHNLLSPLSSLTISTKKVHAQLTKSPEERDLKKVSVYLQIISEVSPRIITSLGEFSKGCLNYNPEPFQINDILIKIPAYCRDLGKDGVHYLERLNIHLDLQEDMTVYADPSAIITHVIPNILKNSGEQCRKNCDVFIATERLENKLILSIEDNAGGIEPSKYNLVMNPIERYSTKGNNRGYGIRSIFKILDKPEEGRTLQVMNRYPEGLSYIIELPLSYCHLR